jgi:zinc transporter ZupT
MLVTSARRRFEAMVPFSAGILLGVVTFGVVPETGLDIGWAAAMALLAGGYLFLYLINRYVYPVCPSCSHMHDHAHCAMLLHGFAGPLVAAAALHAFLDGWSIATAAEGTGLAAAVALHKIPEGVALGALMGAAVKARTAAMAWVLLAELPTVAGAVAAGLAAERLGAGWTQYPLAIAAGSLLFLGTHAIHNEWKRRGAAPALIPASIGAAGAAAIQHYPAFFLLPLG